MALRFACLVALLCVLLCALQALPAQAQGVHRVRGDPGGSVADMAARVQAASRAGTRVEIGGPEPCLSACTMWLGARDVCVHPDAQLGFHGPSSQHYGIGLSPAAFDHWSRRMADHYPPRLRAWFLQTGRHRLVGFHMLTGRQVIAMGARRC